MLKIAATGSTGRMGKLVIAEIAQAKDLELQQDLTKTDILIDFSLPAGTLLYLPQCLEYKIPMVIATTGFTVVEQESITHAAQQIPIFMSPNMSIGINILQVILDKLVHQLATNTTVAITDIHHQHKLDAPSGTALKLMDVIQQSMPELTGNINCNSIRTGEVIGEHNILFTLEGETIEITHKALSRNIFAKGAIKAARWLQHKPAGLYSIML
jgi:4-hydroxy-tetrahydrodipicolinate reductase